MAHKTKTAAAVLACTVGLLGLALILLLLIPRTKPVTADSPGITSYKVTSGSEDTESSQYVKVSVIFDKPIKIIKSAKKDFIITVDGKALDAKVADYSVEAMSDNSQGLIITIHATPNAQSPDKGTYFALYEGGLQIRTASEGLHGVLSADGKLSVRWNTINCTIPSGMVMTTVSAQEGNAADAIPASLTVRVDETPKIRVVTWLQLCVNGQPALDKNAVHENYTYCNDGSIPLHVHQFIQSTPSNCAQSIAEQLNSFFGNTGDFTVTQNGETITIKSTHITDREQLSFNIFTTSKTN